MSLTDTHCHLAELDDPGRALVEAGARHVERVVALSMDLASMQAVLELKRHHAGVLAGLGLHPQVVPSLSDAAIEDALAFLDAHLAHADVVGEVGLDYKYALTSQEQARQGEVLHRQLAMAARWGKPVNLHSRRSQRKALETAVAFTRETGLGAQLHWYTQSAKLVRMANDAGVFISVGPSIIHDVESRRVASQVDRRLLLLETDSPVEFGGAPACPAEAWDVAVVMAHLWDCTLEDVAHQTEENFERFLCGTGVVAAPR